MICYLTMAMDDSALPLQRQLYSCTLWKARHLQLHLKHTHKVSCSMHDSKAAMSEAAMMAHSIGMRLQRLSCCSSC
jgi:hypothetical protein